MERGKLHQSFFTSALLSWNEQDNDRTLPWKSEKDPYKIWLSEIILQQTRALQGLPYYLRFTESYPTVSALAAADDDEVFRLWQGLGYYNRCRNLLATARFVANELNGIFPTTFDDIKSLKGIGPYTAAAIASFAYDLPHAVVDGNVYRVISRYFGIDTPTDTSSGKTLFTELADELLARNQSAAYNQAIMDLGATVCMPKNPTCATCPLAAKCEALRLNLVHLLPVKSKKVAVAVRNFHYLILKYNDRFWVHKRTDKDIWQNLFQPFLIEAASEMSVTEVQEHGDFRPLAAYAKNIAFSGSTKQRLTHRIIQTRFFEVALREMPTDLPDGVWITINELNNYPFPKTLVSWFSR